ncbi:aryl-alcohol oxidase-like protein [Crucibulum laeve]|uniref:pyranose dehydrogenase (acceptor) n=1 Tax=Crucibulum laeve TaxID=68775 RepID=A0A5C3LWY0_9AGAR|nr:aryl-alcohol oxidase-like protein [Crucibulum laeve]
MLRLIHVPAVFALFGSTFAAFYTDPSQLKQTTYDFVIVGAGIGGGVVAARLSENPSVKVLVIEAGVDDTGYRSEQIQIPFMCGQASVDSPFDWNYTTTPQKALNNQAIGYARGFVMGGSSSTNYLIWTRGSSDDFNRFAKVAGDNSYSWNSILPYFKKSERHVIPSDGRNDSAEYLPAFHGFSGPLAFSTTGNLSGIDDKILATTKELSAEFPFNQDTNSGKLLGLGWQQDAIGNGTRQSSSSAYLKPALNSRSNIDVLIHTRATRLLKTGSTGSVPEFKSLEIATTSTGPRTKITARKEIILSAGAIGTPQILMLSGIGNAADLAKVGINSTVSLPEVGTNLQDHPLTSTQWEVSPDAVTRDGIVLGTDPAAAQAAVERWNTNRTGVMSTTLSNHMGFFRLPSNSSVLAKYGDGSSGPGSAHYELAWVNNFMTINQPFPTSGKYVANINVVVSPTSRGSVTLASSDPFAAPLIDPNFYNTDLDLQVMLESIKASKRFISAKVWDGYIVKPYGDLEQALGPNGTDADIIAYIRQWTGSIKHPMCTAPVNGAKGKGVVDANLKVKNLTGVRIVDGSVFPYIPAAAPQAAIYGVSELAADKIKKSWGL